MAWKARVVDPIVANGDRVQVVFAFYDDAILNGQGQPVIQFSEAFSFPPHWSNQNMQEAVQARGTAFRAAKTRADQLALAFPVNTVVNVP